MMMKKALARGLREAFLIKSTFELENVVFIVVNIRYFKFNDHGKKDILHENGFVIGHKPVLSLFEST